MAQPSKLLSKGLLTHVALVWLLASVGAHVTLQCAFLSELPLANVALVWHFASMGEHMSLQMPALVEILIAYLALISLIFRVICHVSG